MKQINLKKGETLINEGDKAPSFFWVQSGHLSAYKKFTDEDVKIGDITEDELVGEMALIAQDYIRAATVIANSDCVILEIQKDFFVDIVEKSNPWVKRVIQTLEKRLSEANHKLCL